MKTLYYILKVYLFPILLVLLLLGAASCINAQDLRRTSTQIQPKEEVIIKTNIFTVTYSQVKEQPISLTYRSSNRIKNVDRGSMDFYTEKDYHTSDKHDYYANIWDKGHLAPAATFSDTKKNLKQTFSYLNCALQNQYLNRGAWRLLEEQERKWDDKQELIVTVHIEFSDSILPSGANIPSFFTKQIFFTKDKVYKCYYFPNQRPDKNWKEYLIECKHNKRPI